MRALLFVAALCAMLAGCGQKGPLFIPNDDATPTPVKSQPQTPAPAQPQTEADHT